MVEILYQCSNCGKNKTYGEFYKDKARKEGIKTVCKECFHKQYLEKRNERILYAKEWNQDNPEKRREYMDRYLSRKNKRICAM